MFTNITHLLCGTDFDEKDIGEATDIYDIPSVTGEWVKACVRLGRLACPKIYHPIPNGLFTPIIAAFTEIQPNDRKTLYALITFHGGKVERNFTSKTTHLICGSATGNVYTKAIEMKSDKYCIVTPDWLYECLNAQQLIDSTSYHPRLLTIGNQNCPSLSEIMGLSPAKTDNTKKSEKSQISDLVARKAHNAQMAAKNLANTALNAANTISNVNASLPSMAADDSIPTKSTELVQTTKPTENVQNVQRNTLNQVLIGQSSNQLSSVTATVLTPTPMEQGVKEKPVCYLLYILSDC